MATKPFQPKLGSARPRVSAALQQAATQQFSAPPPVPVKRIVPKSKKPKNPISLALQGAF